MRLRKPERKRDQGGDQGGDDVHVGPDPRARPLPPGLSAAEFCLSPPIGQIVGRRVVSTTGNIPFPCLGLFGGFGPLSPRGVPVFNAARILVGT